MHLGNGAVTPECAVITWGAAAAGLGWLALRGQTQKPPVSRPLEVGALAALVFALQAVNVPLLPWASAHLVGGVLVARLLGAGLGAWTMAAVLMLQATAMGDGGLLAWGCNVLNMAVLPAVILLGCERRFGSSVRTSTTAAVAAVLLAAVLIPCETAIGRGTLPANWTEFALTMVVTHLVIALFEGAVTFALLTAVERSATRTRLAFTIAAAAAATAGVLVASELPDGYESAADATGFASLLADPTASAAWIRAVIERQSAAVAAVQTAIGSEWLVTALATCIAGALAAVAAAVTGPLRTGRAAG